MSIEEPIPSEDDNERSPEADERVKRYIRLALFALGAVVLWYGLISHLVE